MSLRSEQLATFRPLNQHAIRALKHHTPTHRASIHQSACGSLRVLMEKQADGERLLDLRHGFGWRSIRSPPKLCSLDLSEANRHTVLRGAGASRVRFAALPKAT